MPLINRIVRRLNFMRLDPVTRSVVRKRLTYLPSDKLHRLQSAMRQTRAIEGDVIEFGVALGGSGIMLAHHARKCGSKYYGFDVFGLIPPPTSDKDDENSKQRYDVIASGQSTGIGNDRYYGYREDLLSEVKEAFRDAGVPASDDVLLIKGLFEDTWPETVIARVSLVHVDCDWYDPVKYCLYAVADILMPGGIIVIDDYYDYGGCREAVNEFVADRPDFRFEDGRNPFLRKV